MEFSVTLTGYSEKDGQVLMELEPRWWDGRELIRDARFVKQGGRGLYRDYDADLDLDEVRELYTRYQDNIHAAQRLLCFRRLRLSLPCQKLRSALYGRRRCSHFRVNVKQCETGL
ncbi:MAG: hypothetical protein B0D96_02905 [Candidatus Sedimenticola endophacoides]|uniref:Uncharacterized protein n=1 Tax=Candidatus Sedimenticola endophacoides TaxID=2548426 RepID=A0A6N4E179_9GAMM|nr:MAG: hypothetical protein B0D96_02905 [Candidatus Sedimenticola endophacoides]OQX39418.1 MAG: hypothetical protein B0D89_10810 [Candidatus Sedimenticola endophacoides]OQX42890.1 MAG: hypothetical protein B0D82_00295 [Candidatus Sedimenticola endophacoides]PUD99057.1 MAG: hypothetical protein C3L26_10525 [Candidatus Sedimenticola endophacoides]PUE02523.1 MAG: hypothetical protein C3L25_10540 [Candidatus Sedimenticola endophacoides]